VADPTSDQRPLFAPLRLPKGSELFAQRVRAAILVGDLPEGSALPSENQLVRQLGVSRATVREGLRLLEADGLITTRPGRGGGATVRRPSVSTHTRSLALLLQLHGATLGELLEAWRAIKPYHGRLAAERIRPEELAELRATVADMGRLRGDRGAVHGAHTRFHRLIARATRNAILDIYSTSLAELIFEQIREVPFTAEDLDAGTAACGRILEALERGDGAAAERRIVRHIAAIEATIVLRGKALNRRPASLAGFVGSPEDGAPAGPFAAVR
jgi:GntR family transcriptional regulator, transcriptional repressor for pyruvate dehydrogenase complex